MAKFKVVTPSGAGFTVPGGGYKLEMEALAPLDAEIVEIAAKSDDDFVKQARDADALYAKGRRITKRIIDGLERLQGLHLIVVADARDRAARRDDLELCQPFLLGFNLTADGRDCFL